MKHRFMGGLAVLSGSLGLLFGINQITSINSVAHASHLKQSYGYVIKGKKSKSVHFIDHRKGRKVWLTEPDTENDLGSLIYSNTGPRPQEPILLHSATYTDPYYYRHNLRRVKLIRRQQSLPRVKYWMNTSGQDFYNYPDNIRRERKAIHHGRTFATQQLYAVTKLTTYDGTTYLQLETKSGRKVGWLTESVLTKGKYLSPITQYCNRVHQKAQVWNGPNAGQVRVGAITANGKLSKLIIQCQNNGGTVMSVDDGKIGHLIRIHPNRHWSGMKDVWDSTDTFQDLGYDKKMQKTWLKVETGLQNVDPIGWMIAIDNSGAIGKSKAIRWPGDVMGTDPADIDAVMK